MFFPEIVFILKALLPLGMCLYRIWFICIWQCKLTKRCEGKSVVGYAEPPDGGGMIEI